MKNCMTNLSLFPFIFCLKRKFVNFFFCLFDCFSFHVTHFFWRTRTSSYFPHCSHSQLSDQTETYISNSNNSPSTRPSNKYFFRLFSYSLTLPPLSSPFIFILVCTSSNPFLDIFATLTVFFLLFYFGCWWNTCHYTLHTNTLAYTLFI